MIRRAGKKIDNATHNRIVRLINQECWNALVARIVGVDAGTVRKIRRRMNANPSIARTTLTGVRKTQVLCGRCGSPCASTSEPMSALCWACRHPLEGVPEPTTSLPGTADKIDELARRMAAKTNLWNSEDATFGCEKTNRKKRNAAR